MYELDRQLGDSGRVADDYAVATKGRQAPAPVPSGIPRNVPSHLRNGHRDSRPLLTLSKVNSGSIPEDYPAVLSKGPQHPLTKKVIDSFSVAP